MHTDGRESWVLNSKKTKVQFVSLNRSLQLISSKETTWYILVRQWLGNALLPEGGGICPLRNSPCLLATGLWQDALLLSEFKGEPEIRLLVHFFPCAWWGFASQAFLLAERVATWPESGTLTEPRPLATLRSQLDVLSLFSWKPVKQSRLSHAYKIQGSYLVFRMENDLFSLEGPLVWTQTLSREEREE